MISIDDFIEKGMLIFVVCFHPYAEEILSDCSFGIKPKVFIL
jgi:hypothetical protein